MLCKWNVNYLIYTYTFVIPVYRAPTGDFELFLLENINYFYKPNVESVSCGDINIILLKVTKNSA
jgi:hypothetical protein